MIEGFVSVMLGIAFATPPVYSVALAVHKFLLKTWIACAKRRVLCIICRDRTGSQGDEDVEPLLLNQQLADSAVSEDTLLLSQDTLCYNSLLDSTDSR